MMRARCLIGAAFAGAVLLATQAVAQDVDAGAIAKQSLDALTPRQVPVPQLAGVVVETPAPPIVLPAGGPTFLLKGVSFSPTELLSQADLDAVAGRYVGRNVDLADLQNIVNEVNALYVRGGFVTASAMLPAQDLSSGSLTIQLVEGRVGAVVLAGRQALRREYIAGAVPLQADTVVNAPKLAGYVELFNRTNSAQMQASLQAGTAFGLTDINLAVIEPKRNTLQVFADNLGVESVGQLQAGLVWQNYGMLGFDDRITLYGLIAEGNLFGNAAYNLAITPWGGRAGVSYSRSGIRIVNGPYVDLDVVGSAEIFAANLSQPILNEGAFLLLGNLAASRGTSTTTQSGVLITDDTNSKLTAGLSANYFGGAFNATLSPSVSFVDAHLNVVDQNLTYELYQLSGAASYAFDENYLLSVRGAAQYASTKLLPGSDLFQIGGASTVRGYPSSAASGNSGYYLNLELHRSLENVVAGLEGFAFLDHGRVFSLFPEQTALTSAGVGLNYTWDNRVRGEFSVGVPLERQTVANQQSAVLYARVVGTLF